MSKDTPPPKIYDFLNYRDYLKKIHEHHKKSNKLNIDLSYDNMAKASQYSKSAFSLIINGKRSFDPKRAKDLANLIGLKGHEITYFELMIEYGYFNENKKSNDSSNQAKKDEIFKKMSSIKGFIDGARKVTNMEYYTNWHYTVIRELALNKNFDGSSDWFLRQLRFNVVDINKDKEKDKNLQEKKIKEAINFLKEKNILTVNENEKITSTTDTLKPDWGQAGDNDMQRQFVDVYRNWFSQMLDCAKTSIYKVPSSERHLESFTVNYTESQKEKVIKAIQEFTNKIHQISQEENNNEIDQEVYHIGVQFFPFTKINSDKK
jgi:uncharacterized protein (TIGR02147 family)